MSWLLVVQTCAFEIVCLLEFSINTFTCPIIDLFPSCQTLTQHLQLLNNHLMIIPLLQPTNHHNRDHRITSLDIDRDSTATSFGPDSQVPVC